MALSLWSLVFGLCSLSPHEVHWLLDNNPPVKEPALPCVMVLWYYAVVVLW